MPYQASDGVCPRFSLQLCSCVGHWWRRSLWTRSNWWRATSGLTSSRCATSPWGGASAETTSRRNAALWFSACTAPLEHSPSPSPNLACNFRGADELRYAWLTFPSLHAAFSSYSAIFASVRSSFFFDWFFQKAPCTVLEISEFKNTYLCCVCWALFYALSLYGFWTVKHAFFYTHE